MDLSKPAFLQGTFAFSGSGLESPAPLEGARYQVPYDKRGQLVYFRAGNSSDSLVTVVLLRDDEPMRYFPLGARGAMHVPIAVVEDLSPESRLTLQLAAPKGVDGTVVVDIGFVEV